MSRLLMLPLLLVAATAMSGLQPALAKGVPLRGTPVVNSKPIWDRTGECSCETRWFTFEATPGKIQVSATVDGTVQALALTWGIRLTVFRGNTPVGVGQAVCTKAQKHCSSVARVTTSVGSPGLYYARVDGMAAHYLPYLFRVTGSVRLLRCSRKGCS